MKQPLIAIALICAGSTLLNAAVISDGTFSGWALSGFGSGGMTLETTNGNPGARLNVSTFTTFSSTAGGTGINLNVSTTEALSGSFSLSLDVLSGAGDFGAGQSIALLVQQGSDIYLKSLNVTGFPQSTFITQTFGGTFIAASFAHYAGVGAATPDFDGGTATYFGFAAINSSNGNVALTKYYDNFSLSYTSAETPEPSSLLLVAGGMLALLKLRTRK